jgi:lysozyme family protein
MPWPVSLVHFDGCVNHGIAAATRLLQRLVGVRADGVVGPATLAAIARWEPTALAEELCWQRAALYARIVRNDASQARFIAGWIARLVSLRSRYRDRR